MSWTEDILARYGHNEWANNRVLAAAAALTDEELLKERDVPYGSLAADLHHIVETQVWWLSVLEETRFRAPKRPARDVAGALRELFDASHGALRRYMDGLSDERLESTVGVYSRRRRRRVEWTSWRLLLHLANHGSQHRGEAGLVLASLGHTPGDLDYLDYVNETATA